MKKLFLILITALGLCSPSFVSAQLPEEFCCEFETHCCPPAFCDCTKPTHLNQTIIDNAGGNYQIITPGCYIFDGDICGNIVINASDVCLNLNCHTLTGKSCENCYPYAIAVGGSAQCNILIKCGTIKHEDSEVGGGIYITDSTLLCFKNLTFRSVHEAIHIERCRHVCLHDIDACNNTVDGSLLYFFGCEDLTLSAAHASCTTRTATSAPDIGLVHIEDTNKCFIDCCKINNNTATDKFNFFSLALLNVTHLRMKKTEVNNNSSSQSGTPALYNVYTASGENHCIKDCQFNGAHGTGGNTVIGYVAQNITNFFIECCDANHTRLSNGQVNGIASGYLILKSHNGHLNSCEVRNTVSAAPQSPIASGFYIIESDDITLSTSQAINTEAKGLNGKASGFLNESTTNVSFENNCAVGSLGLTEGIGFGCAKQTINTLLSHNQAKKNSSHGFQFEQNNASTKLLENCAQENGNSGFFFKDPNSFFKLLKNCALNNEGCGFEQIGIAKFTNSIWLGNKAQGNTGGDYCLQDLPVQQAANVQILTDKKACCKVVCCTDKSVTSNISFCPVHKPTP